MRKITLAVTLLLLVALSAACGGQAPPAEPEPIGQVTIYSGRNEELIGPILERLQAETGIEVQVRYGQTAELAATILEEGARSPADLYIAQDAGALGALAHAGRLAPLPADIWERVEPRFRSPKGEWVGLSGRARVIIYNVDRVDPAGLPATVWGFTEPEWKGRIGWAPTNGSFQAFVTALRLMEGDAQAKAWLEGIIANEPRVYRNNTTIVAAVGAGEVDVGLVNHYYLYRFLKEEGEGFKARNHHLTGGDAGAMINVAGAGILDSARNRRGAEEVLRYLLSDAAQRMLTEENAEYPLVDGVPLTQGLVALEEINTPAIDLAALHELEATLQLLHEVGAL